MSFLVTARKYRPATFQEVVAQGHVVNTLLNSIKLDRIAHAYLFAGPRGVGKTTTARIFAKALNCPHAKDGEPCNVCDTCVEIAEGRSIDVIEIDGASNNSVDQVRAIRDAVRYTPTRDRYKMYIIDEIHMLTKSAFNALLKTLEEPPPHAIFIFATTEPHKLLPTVISRCQRYDFRRIATEDIVRQLQLICKTESIDAEDAALFAIARRGDGSMRDAESIFDQVVAFSGQTLTYDDVRQVLHFVDQETFFHLTELIITKNSSGGFTLAENIVMSGYDIQDFLQGLEEHFRNMLVVRSTGEARLVEAPAEIRERYAALAGKFSEGDLLRLLKITAQAMQAVRYSPQPRLKFEVALIDMIKMDSTVEISTLLSNLGPGGLQQSPLSPARDSTRDGHGSRTAVPGNTVGASPGGSVQRNTGARTASRRDTDATEPLRQAESRFREALTSASLSAVAPYGPPTVPEKAPPSPAPESPPHPIVQMLINDLGAVLIQGK
ncbi:MAG: DNA polymerase III subunit gamma/tau [Bacteroidetes bacterium]|nr:DNA polymerase III subunit gamma/tau [Bacteroidota bacterium]